MTKTKRRGRRRKIAVFKKHPLRGWDTGEWPRWIEGIFRFTADPKGDYVELSADADALDRVARKIGEDAVKAFLVEETVVDIGDRGITFCDSDGPQVCVDLSRVDLILSPTARDALIERLKNIEYDADGNVVLHYE